MPGILHPAVRPVLLQVVALLLPLGVMAAGQQPTAEQRELARGLMSGCEAVGRELPAHTSPDELHDLAVKHARHLPAEQRSLGYRACLDGLEAALRARREGGLVRWLLAEDRRALRASMYFGMALGMLATTRLGVRQGWRRLAARAGAVVGGAAFGALAHAVLFFLLALLGWPEDPGQWKVLLASVAVQAGAVVYVRSLWRGLGPEPEWGIPAGFRTTAERARFGRRATSGRTDAAPVGPITATRDSTVPGDPKAPSPPHVLGDPAFDRIRPTWTHAVAVLLLVTATYGVAFVTVTPPYDDKLALMLWLQPLIGIASIWDGWLGSRKGMPPPDVFARVGFGLILVLSAYLGLRLHYRQPPLPF